MQQYIFYNTDTKLTQGDIHNQPYTVDGQPGILPENLVELEILQDVYPDITSSNFTGISTQSIDIDNKTLNKSYTITEITDLETLRQIKLNELLNDYNTTINSGITPESSSITLAAQDSDRNSFSQLIGLLREYEDLQSTDDAKTSFRSSNTTISDINGDTHTLTVTQFRQAIISYGLQINTIWATYAAKRALATSATTIEDLNSVS